MAADLGSTTYSAVAWTAGDVITEAKLDAMVGNDQAYDSHAAQGLLLNNNKALAAKDAAGVNHNIVKLNASDVLEISGNDGWNKLPTENVPTYASTSTINAPSGIDFTKYFRKGDKVKYDNPTTKYQSVIAVTASLLTLTGGNEYAVANSAISNFYYSHCETPVGFPSYFTWTPSYSGGGAMTYTSVTTSYSRFRIVGGYVEGLLYCRGTTGGTAADELRFTVPVTAADASYTPAASGGGYEGSINVATWGALATSGIIANFRYDGANWGLGAVRDIRTMFRYAY